MTKLLSAIMPVFNAEKHVAQAIHSVLAQTYGTWELIIVDDGSTDDSNRICSYYAQRDDRIRLFTYAHGGRAVARNRCLKHISGDVVVICDADDLSFPSRFETHAAHLESLHHPGVSTAPTQIVFSDSLDVRRMHYFTYEREPGMIRDRFSRNRMAISNASSAIARSVFEAFGDYDARFDRAQDYEFFKRVINDVEIKCTEIPMIMYRANRSAFTWDYFWESRRYHWLADHLDSPRIHDAALSGDLFPSPDLPYRAIGYLRYVKYLLRTFLSRQRGLTDRDRERVTLLVKSLQPLIASP